ncbi:Glutamate--cysteine ligase [Pseudovibrio axinellae]|uniref:Glutamate--cysteine ligase n=1 Tax=Pseudovibrio axinellae TaxID=989403 RepID=A0A165ZGF5_9HYPH|nr:glutamate--cysteine ligase [Pseudovibrio axinellae]KZL19871.1 Glutamate--cysteine ligase [Pseudovibrio axinellae]SER38631.1 glutamate-cysteine ligase [Pseudovibrio axinellae]
MTKLSEATLKLLTDESVRSGLAALRVGIEKEALRVSSEGFMSSHDHPDALGKTLTHKFITTDFSEAQAEFITPTANTVKESLDFLKELQAFAARNTEAGEYLWNSSMPPEIQSDESIRVAQYGESNSAQIKTLYRKGLAHRYGKRMQTISGIHYNFSISESLWSAFHEQCSSGGSLQDFRSAAYLGLIRNLQRHGWLVLYLFGASPALDRSYLAKPHPTLSVLGEDTYYGEYATSLRMSDLGYTSVVQSELDIHFNSICEYIEGLRGALATSVQQYEQIGVFEEGDYKQINTHQLQLENELYGSARPKRNTQDGERPIAALCRRGVEYIELRSLDINPLNPIGIGEQQAYFLNTFLTHLALAPSPCIEAAEQLALNDQQRMVAWQGRLPDLVLPTYGAGEVTLREAGNNLLDDMRHTAEMMDDVYGGTGHIDALNAQAAKLDDPDLTPSAQILKGVKQNGSYAGFIAELSKNQSDHLKALPLSADRLKFQEAMVAQSKAAYEQIESRQGSNNFDRFLDSQNKTDLLPPECLGER